MGRLCEVCDYCYATKFVGNKNVCDRCGVDFNLDQEPKRNCPVDGTVMTKVIKEKVIIDRCDKCSGVWLDGNEVQLFKNQIKEAGEKSGYSKGLLWGVILG